MKVVALVPARSGSKRAPKKNIRDLEGHPVLAYTIHNALKSGVFERVIVSTEAEDIAEIGIKYGAEVPFVRPECLARDSSTDFEWVEYTLRELRNIGESYDCFSILRPTNPFRTFETIRRAWFEFNEAKDEIDSIRAVQLCKEHPAKMWTFSGNSILMEPLLSLEDDFPTPFHSRPYQSLPKVYIQNACLEIAWSRVVFNDHSISGTRVMPFLTRDHEGVDINTEYDWSYIKNLILEKKVALPAIGVHG